MHASQRFQSRSQNKTFPYIWTVFCNALTLTVSGMWVHIVLTAHAFMQGEDGPAAEVPLDGTVYDLETGKVLVWCPKNNPLRFVLGSLKVRRLNTPCGGSCSVRG